MINWGLKTLSPTWSNVLRQSSETLIHFAGLEGVGFYPRVQSIVGTEFQDLETF